MDFNDLTQKFTEKVKKLSKDTAEEVQKLNKIRQLNGKVNDAKKQIESVYSEIGKKFFELNKDCAPEEFAELIQTINEKNVEIEQLKEQVREVKGVTVCPTCNTEVSGDERFCPNCGGKMPEIVEPAGEEDEASVVADVADMAEEAAGAAADVAEEVKEEVAEAAEEVKEEAADVAEDVKEETADAVENLKDKVSELAGEAKEAAADIAEGAKEVAGKAFEELKEAAGDLKEEVEKKF